ncbi:MAG: 50S ribosomal protein L24e [archaeon YNP-LCB-003-016]|uniref:50S ribosomal protein L24e n=1 Tax=Candidatus Culexarchaeum yellowstonense TaxID=2928963 RepID=UPI0026EC5C8C|nr:50S ribosomal protein L24e [Candidatus Culexarchaeum yellowstonense]MCC6017559.1 50S ribosomal protein L24e [Candidatus Verstraetearchaeota archaeon]MCR6669122.1 50S ribosomal protein L24e [Candidatus Culexarchaeum yellowstonense]MCR6690938.1 50S ribosomal protein L24e [Candidatus Culexarchaeum yellowstonense]
MSATRRCSFCGKNVPRGEGILYVKSDGSVLFFCSSKCRKNMLYLSRKPADVKWVTKSNNR